MKRFLKLLLKNDWSPQSLIKEFTGGTYRMYSKPLWICGTKKDGYFTWKYKNTWFGEFLDNCPAIISLLILILYYPFMTIIWFAIYPTIGIIKGIIRLLTSKWGDL